MSIKRKNSIFPNEPSGWKIKVLLQNHYYYYDSSVPLYPGMRRSFEANYRPNEMGYYYIKVRVSMGSRRMERWGSFYASFPGYSPTIPAEYYPVIYQGTVERSLVLNYSDVVNVRPGRSVMTNMRVKNIGNATIHEVNLHLSSSNLLDIDLSPKEYYYLEPNQTITFLLDISTPGNIPITEYPIDFELVTRELKEIGTIIVNVTPYDISLEEDIADRILNYELLTAQVERDIIDARSRGINTTAAQESLDEAKQNIQEAKIYLDAKEYDNAEEALDKAKDNLKDAVLKLTQASFAVFVAPAFSPFWILIIIILIAIFLFLVLRRREREKKKPKLLKEAESGT